MPIPDIFQIIKQGGWIA